MTELEVPFGEDESGDEARPEYADPDKTYSCPDCGVELILRSGPHRRTHFAHREVPDDCKSVPETEVHRNAKWEVKRVVDDGVDITLDRSCSGCGIWLSHKLQDSSAERAEVEYTLDSGFIADVALFDSNEELVAVIEVYDSHRVDSKKARALNQEGLPWAEFPTDEILKFDRWEPIRDEFGDSKCADCKRRAKRRQREREQAEKYEELIEQFGQTHEFLGEQRMKVPCPLKHGDSVNIFSACVTCDYFGEVRSTGIFCIGDLERRKGGSNGAHE